MLQVTSLLARLLLKQPQPPAILVSIIETVLMVMPYVRTGLISALVFLGIWFVTQFFNGIASLGAPTAQTEGVAVWAHVGGFVAGVILGFLIRTTHGFPRLSQRV